MTKVYELYHCEYKGKVVYIGQGKKGRHKHCNSGCSHVYELNKIHFNEGIDALEVKVLKTSQDKALMEEIEKQQITLLKPEFNSVYLKRNGDKFELMRKASAAKKDLLKYPRKNYTINQLGCGEASYKDLCEEFLEFYHIQDILNKDIKFYSMHIFNKQGCHELKLFSRQFRHRGLKRGRYLWFYNALKDIFGIDLYNCSYDVLPNGEVVPYKGVVEQR